VSHHSDGNSRNNRDLEVATVASAHGIPVLLPNKPSEIIEDLKALDANIAVLVAYGRIIPQSVIDIFPGGIVNIHPSLLPKYRGPTPIESAIAHGDATTGVSIMRLTAGMDEGPVYQQLSVPLSQNVSKFELYETLATKSAEMLIDILPSILDGSLQPVEQSGEPIYCALLSKADSLLKSDEFSASQNERFVRAHLGFPKTKTTIHGHDIIITKAHVTDTKNTPLDIECQGGAFLSIDELIAPSGKTMNAEAFLRGYAAA
jgi:methionyl-tRNA formyltransferase